MDDDRACLLRLVNHLDAARKAAQETCYRVGAQHCKLPAGYAADALHVAEIVDGLVPLLIERLRRKES